MSKHVLVVEDDKDILELITYNVEREGYEVTGVASGEEGEDVVYLAEGEIIRHRDVPSDL